MCGISGIISRNRQEIDEHKLKDMMQAMKHRGPNDQGIFCEHGVGLGFVRLSIIDLTASGHQPFFSNDKRYVMEFNGEIFNYIELRDELILKGHSFKTKTDTEVLLHAYIEWGKECLHKLNGMWSFAIYDKILNKVFFARDRYGVKPFYYYFNEDYFYFASEIPSILAVIDKKPTPDYQSVFDYLVFNKTEQGTNTFFAGITKLLHGYCLEIDLSTVQTKIIPERWYQIQEKVKKAEPFNTPEEYKELFTAAVGLRLRSDVPVGVCLSGGLDSSAIASTIIESYKKTDLNTFSAVYDSSFDRDESKFINLYKEKPGPRHFITPTAETLLNDLDNFIACHAEPLPTTAPYAQFKVMELAAQSVVVTLDGQGADEELAGYHYFFGFYYKDLLKKGKLLKLLKEMYYYLKIHKSLFAIKTLVFFLLPQRIRTKVKANEFGYINPSFIDKHVNAANLISGNLYGSSSLQESLINHFEYKLEHLLKWEDRNSMFFSLEARVPFLDYRLVERTLATNSDLIIKNGMTKHLLRASMKGLLPEAIRMRVDKNGFMTPQDEWFRTPMWQERIMEIINSKSFAERGLLNVEKVRHLYQKHLNKEISIAREIWKWIHLELWHRKYID